MAKSKSLILENRFSKWVRKQDVYRIEHKLTGREGKREAGREGVKEREEGREVEKAGGCYDTLQLLCYCVLGEI